MATYKHIRSNVDSKRPTTSLADGQIAINTNVASPGLFFKDSAGTALVKVGPVHVGTSAPNAAPATGGSTGNSTGEQWLDTSLTPAQLKVWNGSAWVGVVADELPVSKLQNGSAYQLIQTDAAGTGVEWTDNIDVPGTLAVTSTATFDSTASFASTATFSSIASHPLGTAAAPTITFTGDTDTGVYSPGVNQVALSTAGTGRLFVAANGNIGVATATPATALDVNGDLTVTDKIIHSGDTNTSIRFPAADTFTVETGNVERLRVDSSGRVGIGTISPDSPLQVIGASSAHFKRLDNGTSSILITGNTKQWSIGVHSDDYFRITREGVGERLRITSTGQLSHIGGGSSVSPAVGFNGSAPSNSLVIDSSGRLLVGTSSSTIGQNSTLIVNSTSPANLLSIARQVNDTSGPRLILTKTRGSETTIVNNNDTLAEIRFTGSDGVDVASMAAVISAQVDGTPGANDMPGRLVFSTTADGASSPTERLRIDSSGNVGIGTSSPNALLEIESSAGGTSFSINNTGTSGRQYILQSTSSAASIGGGKFAIYDGDAPAHRFVLDSSGNVGIGTTSPASKLHLEDSNNTVITLGNTSYDNGVIQYYNGSIALKTGTSSGDRTFQVHTAGSERMQIDSSGRLLVGTSSVLSTDSGHIIQASDAVGAKLSLGRDDSSVSSGNAIGKIMFSGNAGGTYQPVAEIACDADGDHANNDKPGRLTFSTTADGASSPTEALRISNRRTSCFFGDTGHTIKSVVQSTTNRGIVSGEYVFQGGHSGAAGSIGTVTFQVGTNGNVQNTNNSYGAISDIKLKENIVDASSQWDDLKALQVRNYNFIEGQTHTQIGVVAQEVELVSPGLVSESPDLDEEGTDLGTVTKSVNYSVLYMKAVKALQEAMERIETLEQRLSDAGIA